MAQRKSPALIAREALKMLAAKSLPPTPANFQTCYNEIAGLPDMVGFPEAPLRQISHALVARNTEQEKQLSQLDLAIGHRNWGEVQKALVAFTSAEPVAKAEHAHAPAPAAVEQLPVPVPSELFVDLVHLVENMLTALGADDERLAFLSLNFPKAVRGPRIDVSGVHAQIAGFGHRASLAAEEQAEIRQSLLKLLHLVLENIAVLTIDDRWLRGQVDALLKAVEPPITLRRLDDVDRRVREVMGKQAEARNRSLEAREELRLMLAEFITRLASMNESSSTFQGRLEDSVRRMEGIKSIEDFTPLLKEVISTARTMTEDTVKARTQLQVLQEKVQNTETELQSLHQKLDNASAQARHDPLTDALNRKGLDEALESEIARVRRKDTPLSLSMLDIDNFKKINDQLGHDTGDSALIHLVKVARACMRPEDTLARYGGEEFVILMPDTTLEQGIQVMTRLQRELTRDFFLAGTEKLLITFSAGVAQLGRDESGTEALRRADQAMYLAKRAGKNRVVGS